MNNSEVSSLEFRPNTGFKIKTIYLAGPISGLSYDDATFGWREKFAGLMPEHIHCHSPMRGKKYLSAVKDLGQKLPESIGRSILVRDYDDVQTCDLIVAHFLDAPRVSIGTCCEFGFAYALQKPLVMINKPGSIHDHTFLTEIAGWVVEDVEQAAIIAINFLTPGIV